MVGSVKLLQLYMQWLCKKTYLQEEAGLLLRGPRKQGVREEFCAPLENGKHPEEPQHLCK